MKKRSRMATKMKKTKMRMKKMAIKAKKAKKTSPNRKIRKRMKPISRKV
jgi:hypothetical protein